MGTNTTDLSTIPTGAEMMAHPVLEDFIAAFGLDSPTIRACIREYDMMLAGPDGDAVRAMHEAGYLVQVMPSDTHDWEPRFVATRNGYLGARRVGMLMDGQVIDGRIIDAAFDIATGANRFAAPSFAERAAIAVRCAGMKA